MFYNEVYFYIFKPFVHKIIIKLFVINIITTRFVEIID